ncbi:delta(3,5)-Delta(2,4)-dienoyl-CoA isomerase, peroxisomal-like [Arachis duranensis]|uniref:Delta(3,5)-Delta(2,4)-dienoyl-CoA isomerase, peroxisomal-like n=1 Tax=Arachis duranensis TaxID=130453 RepID=A0A9C6WK10_ARADU|nr:delta(3,5)-Delta(2,4)-dienoyl-CoA isomerase, peroxisomal-like [Arachis duranensis]
MPTAAFDWQRETTPFRVESLLILCAAEGLHVQRKRKARATSTTMLLEKLGKSVAEEKYKTLEVVEKNPKSGVFHLYLNRSRQRNALTHDFFTEFLKALYALDHNHDVNVIVLSGAGDHFCSGIDIFQLKSITQSYHDAGESLRRQILAMQDSVTALERCRRPTIASIHGACIGGAVDIVTACDLRYCTEDAFFSVKVVDLALAADLSTLQRLPLIVGYGNVMELALTARRFSSSEAKQLGFVSRAFPSKDDLDQAGSCVAGRDFPAALCNRKIIGACYSTDYEATNGKMNDTLEYRSPGESDGHGTHTASIEIERERERRGEEMIVVVVERGVV